MNVDIPEGLAAHLAELDAFIEREIEPLEAGRRYPLLRSSGSGIRTGREASWT